MELSHHLVSRVRQRPGRVERTKPEPQSENSGLPGYSVFRRAGRGSARVLAQTVDCKVRAVVGACGFCGRQDAELGGRGDCGEAEPVHFRARHAKAKNNAE